MKDAQLLKLGNANRVKLKWSHFKCTKNSSRWTSLETGSLSKNSISGSGMRLVDEALADQA